MHRSVFHPKFLTHVKPVISAAGMGVIRVTRVLSDGQFNFETGIVDGAGEVVLYNGKARVQTVGRPTNRDFVEDTAKFQTTRVQFIMEDNTIQPPTDFDGWHINDKVELVLNDSDPFSEHTKLFVHGFLTSTNSWATTLICQANMKQDNG